MANTQGHIYVYGDIWNDQSAYTSDYGFVSLRSVVEQMQSASGADEFVVHIHSRGGDVTEGFAIHDALVNSGKKITCINDGLCASIATVVFLAGSVRKMNANAEFMIHNPWGYGPFEGGDASDFAAYSDELKKAEDKIISLYSSATGKDAETLRTLMAENTYMDAETAKGYGFVTEIIEVLKAVAYMKPVKISGQKPQPQKPTNKMANVIIEKLNGLVKSIESILFEKLALDLATADGKILVVETTEEQAAVGDMCTIDGATAPDATYLMADGDSITVASGKITNITEAADPGAADTAAVAAIKAENDALKATIAEQTNALNDFEEKLTTLSALVESKYKPKERVQAFRKPKGDTPAVNAFLEAAKARNLKIKES